VVSEQLGGGTTHALRMARTGCKSAVSFVALVDDGDLATAVYPGPYEEAPLRRELIDDLVRQLWLDPGIARHKALLRSVRVASRDPSEPSIRIAVATVPLASDEAGRPWGLLGVADPDVRAFGLPDVELLSRIAQRLTSYVAARQKVRSVGADAVASPPGAPPPLGAPPGGLVGTPDLARLLTGGDPGSGLVALGTLLAKTGRLLGAGEAADGSLALVALEVSGDSGTAEDTMARVARAIRADLRSDDLVSAVGTRSFVAVVRLAPGGTAAQALADRLAAAARAALGASDAVVRSAHLVADLASHVQPDADQLLRAVLGELHAA
jgi:hypothetical protein